MIPTNRERVTKALDLLKAGLGPFVEHAFQRAVANGGVRRVPQYDSDVAGLLKQMEDKWYIFRDVLGQAERGLVGEMRGHRNSWAHQGEFSSDETHRALDSAYRLLTAIKARQAAEVENMKTEIGRLICDQPAQASRIKAGERSRPAQGAVAAYPAAKRAAEGAAPAGGRKEYPCPIPGCQRVFSGTRGGWDAHIASLRNHPKWHPDIDDLYERKARFKAEFSHWFQ